MMTAEIKHLCGTLLKTGWLKLATLFIFFLYAGNRLCLLWRNGDAAFGYDAGIYRRLITDYFAGTVSLLEVPMGFALWTNILRFLGASIDSIMYFWYLFVALGIFAAVYYLVKSFANSKIAFISVSLLTASAIQFEMYWWYYYRNLIALLLIVVSLWLMNKRSGLAWLPIVALGIIHPSSLLPLGITMILALLIDRKNQNFLFFTGLSALIILILLNWQELVSYLPNLKFMNGASYGSALLLSRPELSGQFIDIKFFLGATVFYLPFAVWGMIKNYRRLMLLVIFFLTNVALIIFKITLYRRLYIYLDLCLIIFAAHALYDLATALPRSFAGKAIIGGYAALLIIFSIIWAFSRPALISQNEIWEIKEMEKLPAEARIMVLSSYYAPWVLGFSEHRVIAPGMFELNNWGQKEWNIFWYTEDNTKRYELLDSYYHGTAIYIYIGEKERGFETTLEQGNKFQKIKDNLWLYQTI